MIGFCTDSNAQLPDGLRRRYGVEVVPLVVTVDGRSYREGADLDAASFFSMFDGAAKPQVATAAPSPGAFADAYRRLAEAGATEILSVHIGSAISGTINSARLGAESSPVPVRLVDTGEASFSVACCLWEAAEAVRSRCASIEDAAAIAEAVGARCGNVFVVGALDLARSGGRLAPEPSTPEGEARGVPVLSMIGGRITPIADATSPEHAAQVMAQHVIASGSGLRVGVGIADPGAEPLSAELERLLKSSDHVREIVHYQIGPSVGAHTGPGTAGAVFYPSSGSAG